MKAIVKTTTANVNVNANNVAVVTAEQLKSMSDEQVRAAVLAEATTIASRYTDKSVNESMESYVANVCEAAMKENAKAAKVAKRLLAYVRSKNPVLAKYIDSHYAVFSQALAQSAPAYIHTQSVRKNKDGENVTVDNYYVVAFREKTDKTQLLNLEGETLKEIKFSASGCMPQTIEATDKKPLNEADLAVTTQRMENVVSETEGARIYKTQKNEKGRTEYVKTAVERTFYPVLLGGTGKLADVPMNECKAFAKMFAHAVSVMIWNCSL